MGSVRTTKKTTPLARLRRARRICRDLADLYPDAHCALHHEDAYQLLVATILSAQCTDARVNKVTPALFAAYPNPSSLAAANCDDVAEYIRSTGFFVAKSKNLIGMAEAVCANYGGDIPHTMDELLTLPGVGRKTANVLLGNVFGVPGLPVDTHVGRLSRRLHLTDSCDPVVIESELCDMLPKIEWTNFSHRMIVHGRTVCHSRKAACGLCPLKKECSSYGLEGPTDPVECDRLIKGPDRDRVLLAMGVAP